jgi:hypothetical protein
MFDQQPTIELLFEQLGLDSDQDSIHKFIEEHQLPEGVMMHEASFWTEGQRQFIVSHWQKDDNWSLVVDELNEVLSRKASNQKY